MVGPIAAAVAPAVVSSATNEDGFINKLFKISLLVVVLLLLVMAFFILNFLVSIAEIVGAVVDFLSPNITPITLGRIPLIGPIVTTISVLSAAFGFGGRS